jgi:hypothetical protein
MRGDDGMLYVYAIAERGLPGTFRVLGHRLHTLSRGSVDVIAERRREPVAPTTDALREQHAIVAKLMERSEALLPARFGSRIEAAALEALIRSRERQILESLSRVRGRRQMTIRVFGPADTTRPAAERAESGTAFLKNRRARALHMPPDVAPIRSAVGALVAGEIIEPGLSGLRVTVFHLGATENVEPYRDRAATLRLPPSQVVVSGPSAAFAFAPELF